ncbi:Uncharacterized protein dnm_032310 [Desulfonema magnum]|uniref:Uncharacterized protein n=1 Tax=Desulfonema magnum TaxID=45655 RepID=A0A975BKR4_9BACT|nr:Uncharacterized protein dnm_032310 [Desulfonema magnum]
MPRPDGPFCRSNFLVPRKRPGGGTPKFFREAEVSDAVNMI